MIRELMGIGVTGEEMRSRSSVEMNDEGGKGWRIRTNSSVGRQRRRIVAEEDKGRRSRFGGASWSTSMRRKEKEERLGRVNRRGRAKKSYKEAHEGRRDTLDIVGRTQLYPFRVASYPRTSRASARSLREIEKRRRSVLVVVDLKVLREGREAIRAAVLFSVLCKTPVEV